jgi:ABC-type Fe3+/spermidine/putrescine transport system ATPase subunit
VAVSLSINNIVKKFGDFTALDNISFDIEPGKFVTLLGPSGCGETTILRVIARLLEPDEGQVPATKAIHYASFPSRIDMLIISKNL